MKLTQTLLMALYAGLATANTMIWARTVTALDPVATQEAQHRDAGATRAFSNTHTFDGKCLFVDKLSGDFRENLTPVQVAECGTTNGQGWDLITAGKHNNVGDSTLIVSTLTNACLNFDARRSVGNQVVLYSCGGRADGSGLVVDSQLFAYTNGSGPLTFRPRNAIGRCLVAEGSLLGIADCNEGDAAQSFSLEGGHTGVWKPEVNSTKPSPTAGDRRTETAGNDADDDSQISNNDIPADQTESANDTDMHSQDQALESICGRHNG